MGAEARLQFVARDQPAVPSAISYLVAAKFDFEILLVLNRAQQHLCSVYFEQNHAHRLYRFEWNVQRAHMLHIAGLDEIDGDGARLVRTRDASPKETQKGIILFPARVDK